MAEIQTVRYEHLMWRDIVDLDDVTIKRLSRRFKFHHLDLEDCLSQSQRPKIDEYKNYLFIILHIPVHGPKKRIELEEMNFFIGEGYLITIHQHELKPITDLIKKIKKNSSIKKECLSKGSGFLLYEIMSNLFSTCFPLLERLGDEIAAIEKSVFDENMAQRDMLKDILLLKKDIINFKRIILPQRTVIAQLEHKNAKFLTSDLEVYFDDIVDKIEKIWNNLQNYAELVESLQDTNESIISHNTNRIIKTLTIFSVTMLPLTLISGIYGMNINLPFAEHPTAFFLISGVMLGILTGMLAYFRFKKWL